MRPRLEGLDGAHAALDARPQCLVGRIVVRAHHPGDVDHRRAPDRALAERPARLALEVDEGDVATAHEDLAEVEVAVDADPQPVDLVIEQRLTPRHDPPLQLVRGQQCQSAGRQLSHRRRGSERSAAAVALASVRIAW